MEMGCNDIGRQNTFYTMLTMSSQFIPLHQNKLGQRGIFQEQNQKNKYTMISLRALEVKGSTQHARRTLCKQIEDVKILFWAPVKVKKNTRKDSTITKKFSLEIALIVIIDFF
jgi:hypothetical protein